MAAFSCGSTPSGIKKQCTGKDNYDRLMALYHTGTDVKRHLLQHHLLKKKIDLPGYLYGRYQFLPPDDIKRVLRTKNVQLSDLGIYAIDTLILDQCFDLFWDSCLDKDDISLENILNKYKENLYRLYKTSGRDDNESARNARKRKYITKKQWKYLYQGPEMEDIKKYNFHLYLTFPNKGLTVQSFDNDMHFILLSNVCPLYQSLQVVTTNQMKLSRIAVEHEINNEVFYEIWEQIATHLKPMSRYCSCETYYDHKLDRIKKGTLNRIKTQENRKYILESTFDNKTFSEDAEFINRVQKELNLIDAEETKDLVSKLCDKEIPVLLVHGRYIAGSYPLAVEKAARQDLESCKSTSSRQATDIKPVSTSENIDEILDSAKNILVNLQKEQAYRGRNANAKYKEDCTPMTLRFKGNSLLHKNEIEEQIGAYKNNDIRVTSVEDGSILIRSQMFSSAFQSFGYVLTVFDKLLQHTFSTGSPLEDNSVVCITVFLEMRHFSEVVDEGKIHDLTLDNAQGKHTTEEMIVPGIEKCSIEKSESVLYDDQKEQKRIKKHCSDTTCSTYGVIQMRKQMIKLVIKEKERKLHPDLSDKEKFSIWFYNVLEAIGINEEQRKTCQQAAIMSDILFTFTGIYTYYLTGSSVEGTFAAGEEQEYVVIQCDEFHHVFETLEESVLIRSSFLIIREGTTPAGYVKLQVLVNGKPLKHLSMLNQTRFSRQRCTVDKCGRIVLYHMIPLPEDEPFLQRKQRKPTIKTENFYGTCVDNNIALRCKQWPTFAQEWISRDRLFGWPTKSMVHKLSSFGFFVVKKGHSLSPENDLEWQISFLLQERKLMFSLTDVQHKCYTVLKMFNREIIRSNCMTSYHWKTCLFYVIEQHGEVFWKHNFLVFCIKMCIMNMLKWVLSEFCPNYFIPEQNLFSGTLNNSEKHILVSKLGDLLQDGFDCLLNVKGGKIRDYYRTRKSIVCLQQLQLDSHNILKIALHIRLRGKIDIILDRFNKTILDRYYYHANENVLPFIQNLWSTLHRIIDTNTVTEHTTEETKYALSALLPHIYTCLASNIAAIAIKNTNPRIRDFLLLGSFTLFQKGTLSGRLKFISVLYAIERFDDCEYYIDQLNEDYMIHNPSFCCCRLIENDIAEEYVSDLTHLNNSTCVSFLSSELPITPDALKYEMFRFLGISVTTEERAHSLFQWNYRAVVDCNVYFFFLKFLVKQKSTRFHQTTYLLNNIKRILDGHLVKHRDVAFNLIAWVFVSSYFYTPIALECVKSSWNTMNSLNLFYFMSKKEMKWKQYQFNAAKLHYLVALYNTWIARKTPSAKFCFNCFNQIQVDFRICSTCRISTYCSKQCQTNNWKIHATACVIANRCSTKKNTYLRQPKLK